MTVKIIDLIRHADRPYRLLHADTPLGALEKARASQRHTGDCPLTEVGKEQSEELANHLTSEKHPSRPQMILSSPYLRAIETALPLAKRLDIPIAIEPAFQEEQKDNGCHPNLGGSEHQALLLKTFGKIIDGTYQSPFDFCTLDKETRPNRIRLDLPENDTKELTCQRIRRVLSPFLAHIEQKYPHIERIAVFSHACPTAATACLLTRDRTLFQGSVVDPKPMKTGGITRLQRLKDQSGQWSMDFKLAHDRLAGPSDNSYLSAKLRTRLDAQLDCAIPSFAEISRTESEKRRVEAYKRFGYT